MSNVFKQGKERAFVNAVCKENKNCKPLVAPVNCEKFFNAQIQRNGIGPCSPGSPYGNGQYANPNWPQLYNLESVIANWPGSGWTDSSGNVYTWNATTTWSYQYSANSGLIAEQSTWIVWRGLIANGFLINGRYGGDFSILENNVQVTYISQTGLDFTFLFNIGSQIFTGNGTLTLSSAVGQEWDDYTSLSVALLKNTQPFTFELPVYQIDPATGLPGYGKWGELWGGGPYQIPVAGIGVGGTEAVGGVPPWPDVVSYKTLIAAQTNIYSYSLYVYDKNTGLGTFTALPIPLPTGTGYFVFDPENTTPIPSGWKQVNLQPLNALYPYWYLTANFDTSLYSASVNIYSPGTGYKVGDILTIVGGTLDPNINVPASVKVISVGVNGSVSVVAINAKGAYISITSPIPPYLQSPASPQYPTGGSGTGCSLNLTFQP